MKSKQVHFCKLKSAHHNHLSRQCQIDWLPSSPINIHGRGLEYRYFWIVKAENMQQWQRFVLHKSQHILGDSHIFSWLNILLYFSAKHSSPLLFAHCLPFTPLFCSCTRHQTSNILFCIQKNLYPVSLTPWNQEWSLGWLVFVFFFRKINRVGSSCAKWD